MEGHTALWLAIQQVWLWQKHFLLLKFLLAYKKIFYHILCIINLY
jgi:hypothetical protein